MDLISRKAAIEVIRGILNTSIGFACGLEEMISRIETVPSIPAVPLDKLCEWLANSFSDPPCCTLENVRCEMECRGFTQISECWRHVLTEWMEGLDGTD